MGAASLAIGGLTQSARSAEPSQRLSGPHLKLSLAAYSFNRWLPKNWTPDQSSGAKMTFDDFFRYCAQWGLDGCEPTGYYFPRDVTPEYLNHLKHLAFRLGLDISGTAIGNDFCYPEGPARRRQLELTRRWIDHAALLGAPVIRIFAGSVKQGDTEETAIERAVAGIDASLEYAAKNGVFLALENHGGVTSTAEKMLAIVRAVKPSPWFGVNFDSGNFRTADPYADLKRIAPYALNVQMKVSMHVAGRKQPADWDRVIGILRDADYRGYVVLEYEEPEDPLAAIPGHIERLRKSIGAS